MLLIIYGISGVGKTHIGKLLQQHFGFYFWDGDNALTDAMLTCIQQGKAFSQDMRDEYTEILKQRISILQSTVFDKPIVMSQALYKSSNRKSLMQAFGAAIFIHVDATDEVILQRLKQRNNDLDLNYLQKIKPNFELPDSEELSRTIKLENNFNDDVLIESLECHLKIARHHVLASKISSVKTIKPHIVFDEFLNNDIKLMFKSCLYSDFDLAIFKVWVEQNLKSKADSRTLEWFDENLHQQQFDLKIQIQSCSKEAILHFRDNSIEFVSFKETDILISYLLKVINEKRNEQIVIFREKTNLVDEYYSKFFDLNAAYFNYASELKSEVHLIKTFEGNRNFSQKSNFIAAKLYKHADSEDRPTIVYFPGTANTRMLGKTLDKESYKLAAYTDCHVFVVYYRLSPENLYPAALFDVLLAYEYLVNNSKSMGIDNSKLILSGYSSGASLALQLVNLIAKNNILVKPSSLMLISPITDYEDSVGHNQCTVHDERFLLPKYIADMHAVYLSNFENLKNPVISSFYMEKEVMRLLPKIFIFQMGNDLFVKQHRQFCAKLEENGIRSEIVRVPELDHCSWWDNQFLWESLSSWVKKTYNLRAKKFDQIDLLKDAYFFKQNLFSFKVTDFIPFSLLNKTEKNNIDEIYASLLLGCDKAEQVLEKANNHPNCIALQIYAIFYTILFPQQLADEYFVRLKHLRVNACDRELALIEALDFSKNKKLYNAVEQYQYILKRWPDDILCGLIAEQHNFEMGCSEKNIDIWSSISDVYINNHRINKLTFTTYYLAKFAQALSLVGQSRKALHFAGQALAINPFNHLAQSALASLCVDVGALDMGITILEEYKPTWNLYGKVVNMKNNFILMNFYSLYMPEYKEVYSPFVSYFDMCKKFKMILLNENQHEKRMGRSVLL